MTDFQHLANAWMNGAITDEEWNRLNNCLREDPTAAEEFVEFMALHQMLRESYAERAASEIFLHESVVAGPSEAPVNPSHNVKTNSPHLQLNALGKKGILQIAIVTATAMIAISFGIHVIWGLGSRPVASIDVGSAEVRLVVADDDVGQVVGSKLYAGDRIRLTRGHVTLPFAQGAIVTLAGPADLEVRSGGHAILRRGQLMATVPEEARGFTVGTPRADIIDLGTQFGVNVGASMQTHVIVFEGVVEVQPIVTGKTGLKRNRLTQGEAAYIAENGKFHRFNAIR